MSTFQIEMNASLKTRPSYIPQDFSWWWDSDQVGACHDADSQ